MNTSTENGAKTSEKRSVIAMLNPRTWSIKWKARLKFFLSTIVVMVLIILTIGLFQRRIVIRETNDKLWLLAGTKSAYIEDYFRNINQQLRSFSNDGQIIESLGLLSESFNIIESDSYLTPTVTSPDKINTLIESFYTVEVLPALEGSDVNMLNLQSLLPADNKQRILQYLYLAANSKPLGTKNTITKADDGSAYSYLHAQYHPEMIRFAKQAGVADILFIDYKTGYVTYSMKKNLDFATNLFEGPYRNTGLGKAFKSALGQPAQGLISCIDASQYIPALFKPTVFLSSPVFSGSQLLGVVVFTIDVTTLDNLVMLDKEGISHGESLKAILVGSDFLYRSNDPEFVSDKKKYLHKLKNNAANAKVASDLEQYGSTALIQAVDPLIYARKGKGTGNFSQYTSETGSKVLSSYVPLGMNNLGWTLVTQIDKREALIPVRNFILGIFMVSLLIAALLYYFSGANGNTISNRLIRLRQSLQSLSKGEKIQATEVDSADEIGQMAYTVNILNKRISDAAGFVTELGKGNIDIDFPVSGDDDAYGHSMNSLKHSLVLRREEEEKRKKEDELRNWTAHGIAMFNDILRMDNNNLEVLSLNITRSIIEYLSANQGALFLVEEEEKEKYLNMVAAYAYDRRKYLNKRIELGEGLAGNCVLEKKTILLSKIPEDYISISSGLGGSKPGCLLIVPLKKDEDVLGVLEVASFNVFKPHEVEFVEKVAESIAAALITVRLHLQTTQYLERFQQQSEEMKAQDEELRQNIEELQATHEQIERLKQEEAERNQQIMKEMEDYRKLLLSVLDQIPGKIFVKDDQGKLILLNSEVAKVYNKKVEELLGTSDFDNHPAEEAKTYRAQELEIMEKGAETFLQEETLTGTRKFLKTTKMPFYLPHLNKTGLLGIQMDVTDFMTIQEENKLKEKELQNEKALLDALLMNVPENIYFKDKESRFIRFSHSMLKLFGLTKPEELVGKNDFDFFSIEHAQPAYDAEQEIIRTEKPVIDLEEKEVMTDGRVSWVNTSKLPLRDGEGNIIGTFGISKNITHLKKLEQEAIEKNEQLMATEEELRQNLEEMQATQDDMKHQIEANAKMQQELSNEKMLLDSLLDTIPEHIYFKDKESRFLRFSKSMVKLFGLKKAEDLMGKSDFDFFSEEHSRPAFEAEQEIIRTGKPIIDLEEKEVMADGRVGWSNTTKLPLKNQKGEIIGTFGISKDITHLKKLEMESTEMMKAVEGNRKLLFDVLDKVPAKIFLKDENGKFVLVNSAVASVYNKKPEQLIGTSDYDNHPGEDVDSWRAQELEIIKTGAKSYVHEEVQGGKVRHLNTLKMPFVLATTGKTGLLGIQFDVSDRVLLEGQLEKLNKEIAALRKR